jgi:hypothetical protein
MEIFNYIFTHLKQITVLVIITTLIYALVMIGLVIIKPEIVATTQFPSYSVANIDAVNQKINQREGVNLQAEKPLTDSDYGKDEPFR